MTKSQLNIIYIFFLYSILLIRPNLVLSLDFLQYRNLKVLMRKKSMVYFSRQLYVDLYEINKLIIKII